MISFDGTRKMSVSVLLEGVVAIIAARRRSQVRAVDRLLRKTFLDVHALQKARELFAENLAPKFRIFDYLCKNENGLSLCFRDLLDPRGNHGQKRLFLDIFLQKIGAISWAISAQCRKVEREKYTDQDRRIDLYLEFESGLIGIENKPWAGDQPQQLHDYASWLKSCAQRGPGKRWLLVFLSNRDPDPVSIDPGEREDLKSKGNFVQLHYNEAIAWLEEGAARTSAPVVRVFVDELVKFIRTNVNAELDMSEERLVKENILASEESLEAAFLVARTLDAVKRLLILKLKADLESKIQPPHRLALFSCDGSRYSGFGIMLDEGHNKTICFEFDDPGFDRFCWGISRLTPSEVKHDQQWSEIRMLMDRVFSSGQQSPNWPWWTWPTQPEFDEGFRSWVWNFQPWQAIQDGSLTETILAIVAKVETAFQGRMDLLMPAPSISTGGTSGIAGAVSAG